MNPFSLVPPEVRWVDELSGLPCGVMRIASVTSMEEMEGRVSPRGGDAATEFYFGGFAVPPGHPLYDNPGALTLTGGVHGKFRNGVLFWFGFVATEYSVALGLANRAVSAVPNKFWISSKTQDEKEESDE